jgi:hypothetical protein
MPTFGKQIMFTLIIVLLVASCGQEEPSTALYARHTDRRVASGMRR